MNYKVLYRKYRPNNFGDVVEQKYVVTTLQNAIINNKIAQAYIFFGPRGTGKTSIAKIYAKTINCLNPIEGKPCDSCFNCLSNSESPDIIEIDAASNNSVDDVKELINNCKLVPTCSKYKIYIIDEVHMLSTSAFNTLLLTIEDPPPHVIFIFATTNIESVPSTILSRCQRFDFKQISNQAICEHIIKISEKENIKIEEQAAKEIALIADGGLRDALGILEQLSNGTAEITADYVDEYFGIVSQDAINQLLKAIISDDVINISNLIGNFQKNNTDYKTFTKKIIKCSRNFIIENIDKALEVEKLKKICLELTINLNKISINLEPYDIIEMIIINNCHIMKTNEESKLAKPNISFEKIEESLIESKDNASNLEIRINNCLAKAKKDYLTEFKNKYLQFLDFINNNDKYLYSILIDTNPIVASGEIVLVKTNIESNVKLINGNVNKLEQFYKAYTEKVYKFYAISEEKWEILRKEYLNNLKNNVKYKYVEENKEQIQNQTTEIEAFANSFFQNEKIIVE